MPMGRMISCWAVALVLPTMQVRGEPAIAMKARLANEAKEQRRILFEALDRNQDKRINLIELHEAYLDAQIDSPRVRKQEAGLPLGPSAISEQIFNLVDINSDLGIDKKEAEEALLAKVLIYKYRYLPTDDEKAILQAARAKAMKNEAIRGDIEEAASLREQAKVQWDNTALQRKAKDATTKSDKALRQEMTRIDERVKKIFEKMSATEPLP